MSKEVEVNEDEFKKALKIGLSIVVDRFDVESYEEVNFFGKSGPGIYVVRFEDKSGYMDVGSVDVSKFINDIECSLEVLKEFYRSKRG